MLNYLISPFAFGFFGFDRFHNFGLRGFGFALRLLQYQALTDRNNLNYLEDRQSP